MYQPYEDSNVFKRLRQIILEKNIFSYFFFCISREFKISKKRARGEQNTNTNWIALKVQIQRFRNKI